MRYLLPICLMLLLKCSTPHYISNEDLSYLYNFNPQHQPKAKIFYEKPEKAKLISQVPLENLAGEKTYSLELRYSIYHNYEFAQILDSQSVVLKEKTRPQKSFINHEFELLPVKKRFLLVLEIKDLVADKKVKVFTYYHPYESAGEQQFMAQYPGGQLPKNHLSPIDTLSIQHTEGTRTLITNYYHKDQTEVAPPPFITDYQNQELTNLRSDSNFTTDTREPFQLKRKGLFAFKKSTNDNNIYPLLVTNKYFPDVKKVNQLVKGLIYLTPSKTFNEIYNSENPRKAVDSFWLNCADGDKKKARGLIKYYYNGMQKANANFTTYKKGWKTDRGMIYMIFGRPYMVYRNNDREIWVYPNSENFPELEFQFMRRSHPLCGTYYELRRNEFYKKMWFRAVEKWRNGQIRAQQKH